MCVNVEMLVFVLGITISIIGWFLRSKDAEQAAQIKLLFEKHDQDATALQELRVQIAAKHYERPELDAKFDRLDATFRNGFDNLGDKFDRLSDALIKHISKEGGE